MDTEKKDGATLPLLDDIVMAAFGREIWGCLQDHAEDLIMEDPDERLILIASKHGLARKVIYDPDRHGELDAEPGCEIWYWGDEE